MNMNADRAANVDLSAFYIFIDELKRKLVDRSYRKEQYGIFIKGNIQVSKGQFQKYEVSAI